MEFYIDEDGDGFGSESLFIIGCEPRDGYVINADDCDDQDPLLNPQAEELPADGIDQDCDGFEGCYLDMDDDGYGAEAGVVEGNLLCDEPYISENNLDCNDNDPTINPEELEISYDSIDQDCDGEDRSATLPHWEINSGNGLQEAMEMINQSDSRFFSWVVVADNFYLLSRVDITSNSTWEFSYFQSFEAGVEYLNSMGAIHARSIGVVENQRGIAFVPKNGEEAVDWNVQFFAPESFSVFELANLTGVEGMSVMFGSFQPARLAVLHNAADPRVKIWYSGEYSDFGELIFFLNQYEACDARMTFNGDFIELFYR
jgi:hypothetical protein